MVEGKQFNISVQATKLNKKSVIIIFCEYRILKMIQDASKHKKNMQFVSFVPLGYTRV